MLREHRWLIALCTLLCLGAALAYSLLVPPVYESTARILIRQDDLGASLLGTGGSTNVDPTREAATDLELAALTPLASRVARELRLSIDPEDLLEKVETKAEGNSSLISLAASGTSRREAMRLANAFATEYVEFRREVSRRRYTEAAARLRARIGQAGAVAGGSRQVGELENQVQQLELLASLQTGDAEVVQQAALPEYPVRPKPVRNGALGLLLGVALGVALAVLRERLDRRLKKEEQVRRLLPDLPIIASIPEGQLGPRAPEVKLEAFRTLQTNLTFLTVDRAMRSLLLTSAMDGEGKTTTSVNLAWTMAERGERVVMIEADLRRPELSRRLGFEGRPGLSNILSGQGSVLEYLQPVIDKSRNGVRAQLDGSIWIVPSGPIPPNPQALLSRAAVKDVLSEVSDCADKVIVDGSPLGPFSDVLSLAKRVDGVVVIVRLYHSRRDEIERLMEQLSQVSVKPIGVVLVGTPPTTNSVDYYQRSR